MPEQAAPLDDAAPPWPPLLAPATRFILHGNAAVRAAATAAWGVPFAEEACRARLLESRATLWMGPDEYLLLDRAPAEAAGDTASGLERAMAGLDHALVDVSHRQVAVEINGAHAGHILNGGCPLDLDLKEFPVGMCTRTLFAKADIVLWRTAADAFHVEMWRSFGDYVRALLAEVARDC
jgi:sarcosine oxidase subunit gamma